MAAEEALTKGWEDLLKRYKENDNLSILFRLVDFNVSDKEFSSWEEIRAEGINGYCELPIVCYYQYVQDSNNYRYIMAMASVADSAMSESVFTEVYIGEGLILGVEAALACVGYGCGFFAKTPPTVVDGRDYKVDVDTQGNIDNNAVNPDGFNVAAYIVPDGSVELGKASVTGDRVFNRNGYDDLKDRLSESWEGDDGAETRIKTEIENLIKLGKSGDERITYWDSESEGEFVMPSSGIIVVDGTDLVADVKGNFKFTGLIVVRNGNFNFKGSGGGSGTVAVVGAIIAQDAKIDMQNGNPALLYSSEALCMVGAISSGCKAGSYGGGGKPPKIERWF